MKVEAYLKKNYKDKQVIYVPNPGNAGDNLISSGTFHLLDKLKIDYKVGSYKNTYKDEKLMYRWW